MAIAGNAVPTLQVRLVDGALRTCGPSSYAQPDVAFGLSPVNMGSMAAAAAALREGATVRIDIRGAGYQALQQALNETGVQE